MKRFKWTHPLLILLMVCLCQHTALANKDEENPFRTSRFDFISRGTTHCKRLMFAIVVAPGMKKSAIVLSTFVLGSVVAFGITYWAFQQRDQNQADWELMKDLRNGEFDLKNHSSTAIVRLLGADNDESKELLIQAFKNYPFGDKTLRGKALLKDLILALSGSPENPHLLRAIGALRAVRSRQSFHLMMQHLRHMAQTRNPPHALLPVDYVIATGALARTQEDAAAIARVARLMLLNGQDLRAIGQIRFNPFPDIDLKNAFFYHLYHIDGRFNRQYYQIDPDLYRGLYNQTSLRTLGPYPDSLEGR